MDTINLTVPAISCEHCKNTIEREVGELRGVQAVAVDVASKHVSVAFDSTVLARTDIVRKLDEEGYPVAG